LCCVSEASNGKSALKELSTNKFSCVLLDQYLPDMSGIEILSNLKEECYESPIIVLTGINDRKNDLKAMEMGAVEYLIKEDVNETSLERSIRYAVERQKILKELLSANRIKDEFLAAMSHELRTPLNAVIAFSECLSSGIYGEMSEKQADIINRISGAGQHLRSIVDNIFSVSTLEKEKIKINLQEVDIVKSLRFCMTLIQGKAIENNVKTHVDITDKEVIIHADSDKINQVIINLLSNAIKFSEDGDVFITLKKNNGFADITVEDNGMGIDEKRLKYIFKPFEQADGTITRKFGGVGLGLSISKNIVDIHKGLITVESKNGIGSKFLVRLPLLQS
jgi:signal transduction histidine kinase